MKVAIVTGLFTKRNMNIDTGHLAKIRYKNDLCAEGNVFNQKYGGHKELDPIKPEEMLF